MENIITTYKGVNIIESSNYYYPEVNTNIECKSIEEVKTWIDDVYLWTKKNINKLADYNNIPRSLFWNTFINFN